MVYNIYTIVQVEHHSVILFTYLYISQLLDYGMSLKLDNLVETMSKLSKVVQLMNLLCEGRSNKYVQSTLFHLMVFAYQKQAGLPHYKMIEESMSVINEESGEISFSVLSRCMLGDTTKKKVEHMSDMYRNIHSLRHLDSELRRKDNGSNHGRGSWRRKFGPEDNTAVQVKHFLVGHIRAIKARQYTMYDGSPTGYRSKTKALHHQLPFTVLTIPWMNKAQMKHSLGVQVERCSKFVGTNWGYLRAEVWPRMVPPGYAVAELDPQVMDPLLVGESDAEEVVAEKVPAVPIAAAAGGKKKNGPPEVEMPSPLSLAPARCPPLRLL
jgi:hypothetical protein